MTWLSILKRHDTEWASERDTKKNTFFDKHKQVVPVFMYTLMDMDLQSTHLRHSIAWQFPHIVFFCQWEFSVEKNPLFILDSTQNVAPFRVFF